jgi:Protein of unknown function (DUF4089)
MTRKHTRSSRKQTTAGSALRGHSKAAGRDSLLDFIENGARSLKLRIEKSWLPSIGEHLLTIQRHGTNVENFNLPDEVDPAPVFEP